ncbi:MAG: hypothetical protein ACRD3J_18580 [Thermoanaerobaculia bacterium]
MHRPISFALLLLAAVPLAAQSQPPQPQTETRGLEQPAVETAPHDITQVDTAPLGGAISIPLSARDGKRRQKLDVPELDGTRQAVGSQRIDGRLPKPLVDYTVSTAAVFQRLSIFEGGLVVIDSRSAGGPIRKKVILPVDALQTYLRALSPSALASVREGDLRKPRDTRKAIFRVYDAQQNFVERQFDPMATLPKTLFDQVTPMQDLLRAIIQDRAVTNSVAGYMPKAGDELVGDDKRIYKVTRVMNGKLVELHCLSQPTILYVDVKDLYNYFIGTPGAASR